MRFVLRDKLFSIGGDLTIQDDRGRQVFFVDGKVISLGRRLEIKDMDGREVATIQQRLIALTPSFDIHIAGGPSVTIAKRFFSPFVDRMKIDLPGRDDLEVHGDLFHHEYAFDKRGREVAHVSKRWLSLTDAYGVEVDDDEDAVLILACAVVIDEMLDREGRQDRHE